MNARPCGQGNVGGARTAGDSAVISGHHGRSAVLKVAEAAHGDAGNPHGYPCSQQRELLDAFSGHCLALPRCQRLELQRLWPDSGNVDGVHSGFRVMIRFHDFVVCFLVWRKIALLFAFEMWSFLKTLLRLVVLKQEPPE